MGVSISRFYNEIGGSAVRCHHHDSFDRGFTRLKLSDRIRHIHGIALVVQPQDRFCITATKSADSLCDAFISCITVGVLLSKDRNFVWLQATNSYQITTAASVSSE